MKIQVLFAGAVVLGLSTTLSGCAGTSIGSGPETGSNADAASNADATQNHTATPVATSSATATPTPTPTKTKSHSSSSTSPSHDTTATHASTPPKHTTPSKPKPPAPPAVTYRDGSYTENASYASPGGTETIKVTLTLGNDIVTAVSVSTVSADPTATGYEAQFAGGISAAAVGKNIGSLHVGAVAGSSLTANGFNQAAAKIRADAKA